MVIGMLMSAFGAPGDGQEPNVGAGPAGLALIDVFTRLGFEEVKSDKLVPGAPQQMRVSTKTLATLKKLMDESQGISISDGGEVEIIDLKK